jgi:AraC-like DNA-binding protein
MSDRFLISDFGRGRRALETFRDAAADYVCDIGTAGALDDFSFRTAILLLDKGALVDTRAGSLHHDRTPRHVARGGMDSYQVTLCLDGRISYQAGRRTVEMQRGDLCLMDMAQSSRTVVGAEDGKGSRALNLLLPCDALAPLLALPNGSGASLISRDSPHGRLLAEQLLALYGGNGEIDASRAAFSSEALAGLIADAVGSARAATEAVDQANRELLLRAIKRHIDGSLQAETNVDQLCRKFQVSRATLYRLFEPEGGLWRYIGDQRLDRAFTKLASAADGSIRMVEMAVEFHFSSDTTFVRAFRRRFGLTPGEVRRLSELERRFRPRTDREALFGVRRPARLRRR